MRSPRRLVRYVVLALIVVTIVYLGQYRITHPALLPIPGGDGNTDVSQAKKGSVGMDKYVQSSFDWSAVVQRYPVPRESITHLPYGRPIQQPAVQYPFPPAASLLSDATKERREEVKRVFKKTWKNYKKYAWMRDELAPITGEGKDTFGGWAASMIDALDTLWIMDLKEEFYEAVEAVGTVSDLSY